QQVPSTGVRPSTSPPADVIVARPQTGGPVGSIDPPSSQGIALRPTIAEQSGVRVFDQRQRGTEQAPVIVGRPLQGTLDSRPARRAVEGLRHIYLPRPPALSALLDARLGAQVVAFAQQNLGKTVLPPGSTRDPSDAQCTDLAEAALLSAG